MKIDYSLIKAEKNDFEFIKSAKLNTIFDYAKNISANEKEKIINYVKKFTEKYLNDYKIIVSKNVKCGVLLVREFEKGMLLDEIYLLENYRGIGIGSDIIKKEISKYDNIFLFVYKDNFRAVSLYTKLGFVIYEDKGERYLMLHKNKIDN